ncbi:N-acetyltransferase [bacterium]|nr:N-acetyltransferase [bacterium]
MAGSTSESYNRIAPDVQLGRDVKLACFINAYGCRIGDRTKVGAFVEIQKGAEIGADCKISSHTFICEGVHIADRVFVGHNVTFINDKRPRATNPDGSMQTEADWRVVETWVEEGASLGSSVTVMCGVRIGKGAVVGAGSVVTKNIPDGEIWVGNPAKFHERVYHP